MTNFMKPGIMERAHGLYLYNDRVTNSVQPFLDLIYSLMSWDAGQTQVAYNIVEDIFREAGSQVRQALENYEGSASLYPP